MNLGCKANFPGHSLGAAAEFGRGEDVAGLVHQGAGEVLAFANDDALVEAGLEVGAVLGVGFVQRQGEVVDALVLAVGAVEVDVEVGDQGALDQGSCGEFTGQRVQVLVGKGTVLWEAEGELTQTARLAEANRNSGSPAYLMRVQGTRLTQTYDEQALSPEVGRRMEQQGLVGGGLELT